MPEKVLLKVVVLYILRARVGAVNYYDKEWQKGTVIITDSSLYIYDGKNYFRIPLGKITGMRREVLSGSAWRNTGYPVMSIRYYSQDSLVTTLVSSKDEALDRVQMIIEMQGVSRNEVDVTDIELRLLILLYTGINDWNTISAILSVGREVVSELFDSLRAKGLVDSINNLTPSGSRIVRKSGKI